MILRARYDSLALERFRFDARDPGPDGRILEQSRYQAVATWRSWHSELDKYSIHLLV
jgi:hypothetical protein